MTTTNHGWDRLFAFTNGMVAGWAMVFVMQPFQIIKVRLQTQSSSAPIYSGITDCLTKIIKNEGPLALYKGTLTPLFGVGLIGSARFGIFENFKKDIAHFKSKTGVTGELQLIDKTIAAGCTGLLVSTIVCPIEHTRIRIQIQKSQADKIYSGSFDAAVKIYKNFGIRGLFRGQGPSTVRQGTGLCLYFTVIEKLTSMLAPPGATKRTMPIYVPIIAGGIGGTFYWVFNYPFDYVKTLMQSDNLSNLKYKTMGECFRDQYKSGGWRTFFKGYVICMMRSFPVNAAAVTVFRVMENLTGSH